jgi:mono/diheme cytochrome c family protein
MKCLRRLRGPFDRSIAVLVAGLLASTAAAAPLSTAATGVQVTFTPVKGGTVDARHDRLIALYVPSGTPPSPFLAPGPFRAHWEAALSVPLRSTVSFSFEGAGSATLSVNDVPVLEEGGQLGTKTSAPITLNKGRNKIAISYASPDSGDAVFRLFWSGKDFGREPLPPAVLSCDFASPEIATGNRLRTGRSLFAERHCAACHADAAGDSRADEGMPEMAEAAPSLQDADIRFRADWVAAWIADPKKIRPDATMPRLPLSKQDAADIAVALTARGRPGAAPIFNEPLVASGARLFVELRCVACHALPGQPWKLGERTRVSLEFTAQKWQPAALIAFLLNPRDYHPAARMPQFRLSNDEAASLAAFVLSRKETPLPAVDGDLARGAALIQTAGCLQCHDGIPRTSGAPAPTMPSLARLERGCLAETPDARGKAPDFAFDPEERAALRTFVETDRRSLRRDSPPEFAERQFAALRCAACHACDGRDSSWGAVAAEVGALREEFGMAEGGESGAEEGLDQEPPDLTWAGEKLKLRWLERQIAGELPQRARPWLKARMPGFAGHAEQIAKGLTLEHGQSLEERPAPKLDAGIIETGRKLVGADAFNCIACHAVGEQPASAPFGAPGINFALVSERLRMDYFRRWLDYPQRITPSTKMPKFTDPAGRSLQTTVLGGDAHAQWDAIHAYLEQLAPGK